MKAEEVLFPNGVPASMTMADFGRLIGVSPTQAGKILDSRPDMAIHLPGTKTRRVRSELYYEIAGKK